MLDAEPGTLDAGLAALPLIDLAALVLDTLGLDAPVAVSPPPAGDVSGRVDTTEFRRRLGVGDGAARLERELRSFVDRLVDDRQPRLLAAAAGGAAAAAAAARTRWRTGPRPAWRPAA